MSLQSTDRLRREMQFHDRQALERAAWFQKFPQKLRFTDEEYLNHETWIRPALKRLNVNRGMRVLDLGCGHGMAAVILARQGAEVTAIDLSSQYLTEARQRSRANATAVAFVQADGERLPFADSTFDRVWGNAVLHHLDVPTAAREIRRVLKPDGIAVFCEPWGENPVLNWARKRLRRLGEQRTVDEQPFTQKEIALLRHQFKSVDVRGFQLLSAGNRRLLPARIARYLQICDTFLLAGRLPMQRWCRYVVITVRQSYNDSGNGPPGIASWRRATQPTLRASRQ